MKQRHAGEIALPSLSAALVFCGLLTIYGSSAGSGEPFLLAGKQLIFFAAGSLLYIIAARIPLAKWFAFAPGLAAAALLAMILLRFGGVSIHGMKGWFRFGPFFLQPSELAKGIFVLMCAVLAIKVRRDPWRFAAMLGGAAVWSALIFIQPDFGGAATCGLAALIFYFVIGGRLVLALLPPLAMTGAFCFFISRHHYALNRILGFLEPELYAETSAWHIRQFQLAIARGGWTGTGLDQAVWSNAYLPFAYNDSAFAALVETVGAWGGLAVIALASGVAGVLFAASLRVNERAKFFLSGLGILWSVQCLIHIGVNVTLLPTTGITLPLVSYGGSSLCGWLLALGMASSAMRDGFENERS